MSKVRILVFSLAGCIFSSARSETVAFTNHVGRVITGEFGGVTNKTFCVAGKCYPLSILKPGEQVRAKRLAGVDVRSPKEKRLDHAREMRLRRISNREAEGEIDHETADRLRRDLGPDAKPDSMKLR